jgi:hypothetical protein
MKRIEKEVFDFLERIECYTNPHNVDILIEDGCIYTTSWWMQQIKLHISVGAYQVHDNMRQFITDFNISDVKDLGKIKHEHLMEFYAVGRACLFCYVGDNCLFYKKKDDGMVVIDDTVEHPVTGILSEPSEFITHTRNYFGLL